MSGLEKDSRITALEDQVQQQDSEIGALQAQVQQRASEVGALEARLQEKDSEIAALEARVRQRESEIEALRRRSGPAQLPIAARRGKAAGAAEQHPEAESQGEALDGQPSPGSTVARGLTPTTGGGGREADDGEIGFAASEHDEPSSRKTIITSVSMTPMTQDFPEADDKDFGISKCQLEEAGRRQTVHEEVVLEQFSQLAERLPAFLGALAAVMKVEVPRHDHEEDAEACEKTMSALEGVFPELERQLQSRGVTQ